MKNKNKIILITMVLLITFITSISIYFHLNPSIAVLGYHSFYDKSEPIDNVNQFVMEIDTFEKQMKYLSDHHFKTLTLDEFYCWKQNKCNFPRKSVLITMDDGYVSNYKYAFEILKKYNLNATIFFIGSYTPEKSEDEEAYMSLETIRKTQENYPNIEFASHSFNMHGSKNVTNMTKEEIMNDIEQFNSIMNTRYIAYPEGKQSESFTTSLKENGYRLGFGFGPKHKKVARNDDNFNIPRLSITKGMPFWKFKLRIFIPY